MFFLLSANTEIYAGLYEDLNKIKQSRFGPDDLETAYKKKEQVPHSSFGALISQNLDFFNRIVLEFKIFLSEIIENKPNFKNLLNKITEQKNQEKEIPLEIRMLLAK
ncbi:hypothetical protein [Holospora undulata]|uniref:Uncharacterized protein n=1 Tax=Holospora undulata HU1 TaxID=1321371 RepID=A0A061JHI9_9PROT|nr:hypothetical protein [Holospora undulata]ETZ04892.1 hypothetical protein K737_300687 [Holospora undulata HU1]